MDMPDADPTPRDPDARLEIEPERAVAERIEPEREMWERAARLPPEDESVRMFRADWMEKLSHVHPLVPHVLYVPVVAWMVWRSVGGDVGVAATVGLAVAGLAAWTVTEFLLHRFVFHEIATEDVERSVARKVHRLNPGEPVVPALDGFREKFYFVAHGVHHEFPSDPSRLVMPPSVSIPLALGFYALFSVTLGPTLTPGFFAGFVAGYLVYDTFHYAIHFIRPGGGAEVVMYRMGKGHMRHHFADNSKDYGVSSPIWDLVLGTFDWRERSQFRWRWLERWVERRRGEARDQ